MAADEVRRTDQTRLADRARAKPQVRHGHSPCFFRIVNEVALCIVRRVVADNADAVVIGADGTIGTETEEHGTNGIVGFDIELRVVGDTGVGHIVDDTHGEMVLRLRLLHLIEDALDHRRVELLARQPVTPADDCDIQPRFGDRVDTIQIQRLPGAAGLLGSVESSDQQVVLGNASMKCLMLNGR